MTKIDRRMRILYLGICNSDYALQTRPCVSMSAVKWARGLLTALKDVADISAITHTVERCWPKGRALWGSARDDLYDHFVDVHPIGYPALPWVGDWWLSRCYRAEARRIFRATDIDAVICYNCNNLYHQAVMHEARCRGIPAIPIILDGDDPRADNWKRLRHDTRDASGLAMLSWWVYENFSTARPKLHMDGGADDWKGGPAFRARKPGPKRVVYTGALARWSGVGLLLGLVRRCRQEDIRFVICGKVEPGETDAFRAFPNVELRGFVSEGELDEICRDADVFLNVREPNLGENIMNYPSKLPRYLAYGKPVVSTMLKSLSPDYDDLLLFDRTDSVDGLARELRRALDEDDDRRRERFERMRAWFVRNKTWPVQARRLVDFIRHVREEEGK